MKKLKKITPLLLLIVVSIIAFIKIDKNIFFDYKEYITLLAKNNLFLALLLYFLGYIIFTSLSLPVATALTILSGVLFGPILGTFITVISATFGASIIFLAIKYPLKNKSLLKNKNESKRLLAIQNNIIENQISYMLFLRLVPLFPFGLVNIAPATLGIKFKTFFWTTFIGIIPGAFIYTYLGYQTGKVENIEDLFSTNMTLALVMLGSFTLIPIIFKKNNKNNTPPK